MELVCIVHSSPRAQVHWYRDGQRLRDGDSNLRGRAAEVLQLPETSDNDSGVNVQRVHIGRIGRKHLLTLDDVSAETDAGIYSCHAVNEMGEAKANFQLMTGEQF